MDFNFLDLYKKIQSLDSPLNESMQPPVQAIGSAPSGPTVGDGGGNLTYECSGMGEQHPPEAKQQDSVTMSINMNGNGAGGIRDLMDILKNIDQEVSKHSAEHDIIDIEPQHDEPQHDEPEHDIVHMEPEHNDEIVVSEPAEIEMDDFEMEEPEAEYPMDEVVDEPIDYANDPDIQQKSVAAVIGSGDDLNKTKPMFARSQPGDNAMAVSESLIKQLINHYTEVKYR